MLNSIFRGLLGTEEAPTKVIEVRSDNYISRPIHYREDSILLYGPKSPNDGKNTKDKYFEIVLHKPFTESLHQMYSLCRAKTLEEAEEKFIVYKERIPIFIKITKECTVAILQKLCDTLSQHQSWTIAHMMAHFGLSEQFNDPEVQKHLDDIDPLTGATPLMVAVKSCNVRMVQSLVSLHCSLDVIDLEGNTVFHYAAASNKEIINALASKSPSSLNVYNKQGYTPLHTACLADAPDCVRALMLAGADVNLTAAKRSTGLLPVCFEGNLSAVRKSTTLFSGIVGDLLQDNQPKLYQQDMKHGGTPLHWAISREVVVALVDKNCDINALNFDGRTALHIMVLRGRLECAMALLSRGAEHSIGDNEGNTPLHLAVKQPNIAIVQALIVFGANLEAKNNMGNTPRHTLPTELSNSNYDKILYVLHAVGAKRCAPEISGCRSSCSARGDYNGVPPPPVARSSTRDLVSQMLSVAAMERAACYDTSQKQGRLLCLDGGGIRGLVLVQVLLSLEEAVGRPIVECFDWVAGTSTGGILALGLASGKSLRECQRVYFRLKECAFIGMRPYPSEALETILKDCLGTETVMSDIQHPKLMILALLADRKPVDLHLFRNYKSAQEILDEHNGTTSPRAEAGDQASVVSLAQPPPPSEQLVWQAARATGAAPSYFRASGRYLDGGLMGNNPTLDVLTELTELNLALRATGQHEEAKKTNLKVVVSCGTGLIPVSKLKDIDVFKPESLWDTARLAWGLSAIGGLLVDQATQSDGRVVDRARAWCSAVGVPYYRFSPQMSKDVAMDEKNDETLVTMLWEAQMYMYSHRDRVAELAALLNDTDHVPMKVN
ncbi:85/88 kDa calcium-independent phospholipase A2 isoform X1 [Spodoptera frugiperda]|uniref:phospholipase A2 n=1 Tax=Spodoptera frugiperda TaxID=7108 RepID=A0A9R0ESY8_SPOFR|nr:85/88 kDa calcium-independent phospholipase A2 isoform X1 [Spodoptera frugiperda]